MSRAGCGVMIVLVGIAALGGCRRPVDTGGTRTVAYIVPTLSNPFFVEMTDAARQAAAKDGVTLTVQAPAEFTDVERQVGLIENAITARVAAICLVAADSRGVVPALRKAQDAGIPVVLVDNTVDAAEAARVGLHPLGHVGSDNFLGGQLAGRYLTGALQRAGELALLEGVLGSEVANARKAGFMSAVRERPGFRVVASQSADYDREKGLNVFRTILQAHGTLKGLFAANDEMALGAIKALKETGRKGIVVVGFDATREALAAVESGTMGATVQQQPSEMGRTAVDVAVGMLNGKSAPRETMVPVRLVTRGQP